MFEYRTCGLSQNDGETSSLGDMNSSKGQQELGRAAGFAGERLLVGAVETVKFEESRGPSRANASESVGLEVSWRDLGVRS